MKPNLRNSKQADSKKTWDIINRTIRPDHQVKKNYIDKLNIGNIVTSHPKDIANALNEFFANVGSNIANSINSLDDHRSYLRDNYPNSFFFSSVTNENVKQCIMSLKNKKCGLNDFPVKVLKQISPVIVPILTYLVNLSVTNGRYIS